MHRRVLIPLALLLGCGDGGDAAIRIAGEPLILLVEGQARSALVSIESAPSTGTCAPPLDPAAFVVSTPGGFAPLFDRFELSADQGELTVLLEPRCDMIEPDGRDVLVEFEVASTDNCARPAIARLQIAAAGSDGCAPLVEAWTGDCSAVPDNTSAAVMLPASEAPGSVCVRFESRDPVNEPLSIISNTDVPPTVLDPDALPHGEDTSEPLVFELPFGDTTHLTGAFAIGYRIARNRPVAAQSFDFSGSIAITIGDAPLAIDVPVIPVGISEFSVVRFPVRLRASVPGEPVCARATRVPPPTTPRPRLKPDLRLENPSERAHPAGRRRVFVRGGSAAGGVPTDRCAADRADYRRGRHLRRLRGRPGATIEPDPVRSNH